MKIIYGVGYFLYINIFLFCASLYFGLGHPFFNIDYLLLLIFCCFPRNTFIHILLAICFLCIYFIDVILMVMQIFPFVRLTDLIYLSNFIFYGPVLYRTLLWIVILNGIVNFFILKDYFFKKIQLNYKQFVMISLLVLGVLFVKHLLNPLEKDEVYARFEKQWVDSQLLFFIKNRQSSFIESVGGPATKLEPSRYKNATQPLFAQLQKHQPLSKKILIVVNESWGETLKPEYQAAILAPIYQKRDKLEFIQQGAFNNIGATVAGELRELCQKQPTTFNLKDADDAEFKDCLPNKFKELGYKTHAVHGAMSIMYDRSSWYPKAGFEDFYSFEQLSDAGLCFSFSGRCDVKLIPHIKSLLGQSDKSLVYWMTLNTHAPYDDKIFYGGFNCAVLGIKQGTESCNNFRLQYQFFTALSQLIDDPKMQGVEVYVAGDHSPPIFNIGENFFSFKNSDVAWIHFKIK